MVGDQSCSEPGSRSLNIHAAVTQSASIPASLNTVARWLVHHCYLVIIPIYLHLIHFTLSVLWSPLSTVLTLHYHQQHSSVVHPLVKFVVDVSAADVDPRAVSHDALYS